MLMNKGTLTFEKNKTYIMGILNVTPDSFSDGGLYIERDLALRRAEQMISEGADIIDVGGESTRPGFAAVTEEEERDRTCAVIEDICGSFDIPVSIDTYKDTVAEAALSAGARIVNDIWGLREDHEDLDGVSRRMDMGSVVKKHGAYLVLMHNARVPYPVCIDPGPYTERLAAELSYQIGLSEKAGIGRDRLILDPGLGFGKTYEENLTVLKNLEKLNTLGLPLLLGASRKSFIGQATGTVTAERLPGTLLTTALAVKAGWSFVRVHDIKENRQIIDMMKEIQSVE